MNNSFVDQVFDEPDIERKRAMLIEYVGPNSKWSWKINNYRNGSQLDLLAINIELEGMIKDLE